MTRVEPKEKPMPGRLKSRWILIAATVVCFAVALIAFTGLILSKDTVGRAIFGATWTALAVVWLGRLAVIAKRTRG